MYSKDCFKGKRCLVLGLGISNRPLIDYLISCGAVIEARDKKTSVMLGDYYDELINKNVGFIGGDNYLSDLSADFIFRSPGIRPDAGDIIQAVKSGAKLLSETELFIDLCPCKIIGITGSDGKTTTSTLTAELLKQSGKKVWLGGNIGTPLLASLDKIKSSDIAVLELSSFQLMTFSHSCTIAAVTNISENHLNWHKDMEEYVKAKSNIFSHRENNLVIFNAADGRTPYYISLAGNNIRTFSRFSDADICLEDGYITAYGKKLLNIESILIPGRHNIENYMTAIALTLDEGVTKENIYSVASGFRGVPHRLEFIREYEGVRYFNSSIDSTPTRTKVTLEAMECRPIVICGGQDKHLSFKPLARSLSEHAKAVIITGEAAVQIKNALEYENCNIPVYMEDNFQKAIYTAKNISKPGDTVLLSPSCTSFDRFSNFEERGNKFKDIINNL